MITYRRFADALQYMVQQAASLAILLTTTRDWAVECTYGVVWYGNISNCALTIT